MRPLKMGVDNYAYPNITLNKKEKIVSSGPETLGPLLDSLTKQKIDVSHFLPFSGLISLYPPLLPLI